MIPRKRIGASNDLTKSWCSRMNSGKHRVEQDVLEFFVGSERAQRALKVEFRGERYPKYPF